MSLLKHSASIAGFTLLSRILGFVRDVLFATVVGTGIIADAFVVAFRFPNMFRALFAEGTMNSAFVPIFSKLLHDKNSARAFAQSLGVLICGFMVCFVVMGVVLMPQIMAVQAYGFGEDSQKLALTIDLARIMFPYLLFMVMTAFFAGILNSFEYFSVPAFTPCILNIVFIVVLVLIYTHTIPVTGYALAVGVLVAGGLQAALVLWGCVQQGIFPFTWAVRITQPIRDFFKRVLPVILGASVLQLNIFVGTILATTLEAGSVSYLYYADRLVQLPLGVIGIAISVALIPMLSKAIANKDWKTAHHTQSQAIVFAMALTVPSAVALAVIPVPIISGLFGYGAFGGDSVIQAGHGLHGMAFGLPAFVLIKVLTPAFFARGDTRTPVRIAIVCMGVNLVLSIWLMQSMSFVGLAMATSISAWCNVMGLVWVLYRRNIGIWHPVFTPIVKIMVCSAIMGGVLWICNGVFYSVFSQNAPYKVAVLVGMIVCAKSVYMTSIWVTKTITKADIQSALRR